MCSHPKLWPELTGVPLTDADAQQAFVDILTNDVIKPLEILKASQENIFLARLRSNGRVVWKEANDKTRRRIERDLKSSAENYADYAENTVSKLQQAYLRKYQPQQHASSANISQNPQDISNKTFGLKMSSFFRSRREDSREPEPAKPAPSEEGIAEVTYALQLGVLNEPSAYSVRR